MNIQNVDSKFNLIVDSEIEQYRVNTFRTKEPETLYWIENEIKDGDVVFDVGANIGIYTLYIAKLYPNASIYSFEPYFDNYVKLCHNAFLNKFDNVTPMYIGISDKMQIADLYIKDETVGSSGHQLFQCKDEWNNNFTPKGKHSVLTISLDDFCTQFNVKTPQHVKIDIDGLEQHVVEGMIPILYSNKIKSVLIEVNHTSSDGNMINKLFYDANFTSDNIYNQIENHSRERRKYTQYKDVENIIYIKKN